VRGLDYYTRTTFEIVAAGLGAQNALLGGGRYDNLVKQLGGPDRPGIGFAAGLERLVLTIPEHVLESPGLDVFVAALGDEARDAALVLLHEVRTAGFAAQTDYDARTLKSQLKRADRLRARRVVIVGGDELARGEVSVKDLAAREQTSVKREQLVEYLRATAAR
jgi:histidyl-tRNA synthetase